MVETNLYQDSKDAPLVPSSAEEGFGGVPQDTTDYFDPLDFARPSFEAAKERFMDAGKIETDPDDPALYVAFKRSMDYLADTGMAGLELSDAAFKAAIGTVAELVPGQGQEAEKRLERDLYSMPEAFLGVSPARIQQATDTVAEGVKEVGERLNRPSQAPRSMDTVYSIAGASAVDFPKDKLKKAQEMQQKGVDKAIIWEDTGLYLNPYSSQWEFEVSPAGAKFKVPQKDIFSSYKKVDTSFYGKNEKPSLPLTNIFDFPELFKNYPSLKKVELVVDPDLGHGATFDSKAKRLAVGDNLLDPSVTEEETFKEIILHELQHGIQSEENWTGGINVRYLLQEDTNGALSSPDVEIQSLIEEAAGYYSTFENTQELSHAEKAFESLNNARKLARKKYLANEGEIQARTVMLRNQLTENERRSTPLNETYRQALSEVMDKYRGSKMPRAEKQSSAKLTPNFAKGGLATEEQMDKLYQEGGLADDGTDVEPVTGNEVPTGSLDQEVRDDIPAQLSEGEYVVPADVVRYYGVKFFEDLRGQAKQDFARMEAEGRVGGEPVDTNGVPMEQDEELTPEEMQMLQEALGGAATGMAMGGMVPQQQQAQYNPYEQQQMQYSQPMFQSSRVGMQEGGDVPSFNPSDYSFGGSFQSPFGEDTSTSGRGGMQLVEYINPTSGQTRMITVLNGEPIGMVPEGFIPSSPEARQQAQESKQEVETKTEGTREESGRNMDGMSSSSTRDSAYSGALSGDVEQNLSDQLSKAGKSVGLVGNIAGLVGALIGGPVIGSVAKGLGTSLSESTSVDNALETAALADIMGYTDVAEKAREKASSLASDFEKDITDEMIGKANSRARADFNEAVDAAKSPGLKREAFDTDEAFGRAMEATAPAGMSVSRDSQGNITGYSRSPSQAAPTTSQRPQARPSSGGRSGSSSVSDTVSGAISGMADKGFGSAPSSSGRTGGDNNNDRGGGGLGDSESGGFGGMGTGGLYSKGGLAAPLTSQNQRKPNQRKKPVKNKRKGLASK